MERRIVCAFVTIFVLAETSALCAELSNSVNPNEGWKLATESKGVAIHTRPHPGSPLKEFKAVGEIDASSGTVHSVIDDLENYPKFMPYTAECRLIKRESDSIITYQRLSPKICADRAYTLRVQK